MAAEKAEVEQVEMADGRTVGFAGKRKVLKEILIDDSKIAVDGDTVTFQAGAVGLRMDFRNGATFSTALPVALLAQFAGHGASQKYGDELASSSKEPMNEDDMVLAIEALDQQIQSGEWRAVREGGSGGGVSGAGIVVRAIMEHTGKSADEVKAFINGKLDAAKAAGQELSRRELYAAFRNPNTKIGQIIKRMEEEKAAKNVKADGDELLKDLV